jgi:hypothetical protein
MTPILLSRGAINLRKFSSEFPLQAEAADRRRRLHRVVESVELARIDVQTDARNRWSFAHQPRQRVKIHHALQAEKVLDQRRHRKRHRPSLSLEQVDLDEVTDADAQDLTEPGRDGQAAFRQDDRTQVLVDHSAQVGVVRSAADHGPAFDAAVADADRNLSVRLGRQNPREPGRFGHDDLRPPLDEFHGGMLPVRQEERDIDQILGRVDQEQRHDDDCRGKRHAGQSEGASQRMMGDVAQRDHRRLRHEPDHCEPLGQNAAEPRGGGGCMATAGGKATTTCKARTAPPSPARRLRAPAKT